MVISLAIQPHRRENIRRFSTALVPCEQIAKTSEAHLIERELAAQQPRVIVFEQFAVLANCSNTITRGCCAASSRSMRCASLVFAICSHGTRAVLKRRIFSRR